MKKSMIIFVVLLLISITLINGCKQKEKFPQLTADNIEITTVEWEGYPMFPETITNAQGEIIEIISRECEKSWKSEYGMLKFNVNLPLEVRESTTEYPSNVSSATVECRVYIDGKPDDTIVLEGQYFYNYKVYNTNRFQDYLLKVCCRGDWVEESEYTFTACQSAILNKLCE